MKRKKLITFFTILLLAIILGGWYAYKEFNRKSESASDLTAAFSLSADEMTSNFSKDSQNSNLKYLNKVVEITGNLKMLEQQSGNTIVLSGKTDGISIRCSMDSSFNNKTTLVPGTSISIKGIYTGFNADELGLGADILINKAIILQK